MANLVEQQEAKRREERDREREEQRRQERLEQQREQLREEERDREREEQARQEALDQARAYELESERRQQRHQRYLDRARAERRERAKTLQREQGRFEAARQAAAIARRAVASAQQSTQQTARQRAEARLEGQREAERQSRRDVARKEGRDAGRRDDQHRATGRESAVEQRRAAARQAARDESRKQAKDGVRQDSRQQARRAESAQQGRQERRDVERRDDQRRESGREKATEERRAAARQDSRQQARRQESAQARREDARVSARAGERAATRREEAVRGRSQQRVLGQRQAQRAQDRAAELGRAAAEQHRRDRAAATGAVSVSAVRVHGPLLLDAGDQPVRLRGVLLTGLESPQRDQDGSVWPAATDRELDEIARWGATLVVVPLSLDALFEVPALVDDDLTGLPAGAELIPSDPETSPYAAVADPSVLEALDATVEAAAERGMFTLVQLGRLRGEGDDRQVGFAWLRQFWRVVGARYESSPTVLFDLLRGPAGGGINGTMVRPDSDVAWWQRQSIALALLGELRGVHPGAVAVVESPEGVVPPLPMSLTDGSVAPNVIAGVRLVSKLDGLGLAAVAALARRVPVVVVAWGVEAGMPPQDVVGRRLAAVGAHWVAGGWPRTGGWPDTGRVVPTEAGRAVQRALAAADRPALAPQDQE